MNIRIISVGKTKDKNILSLINKYTERLASDAKIEFLQIKDSSAKEESEKILEILDRQKGRAFIFVLSEEGKEITSSEFAGKLRSLSLESKKILFIIGGSYGLDNAVKQKTNFLLSLSKMTFTHEMSLLFLTEQIYRAITILKNKSYHH